MKQTIVGSVIEKNFKIVLYRDIFDALKECDSAETFLESIERRGLLLTFARYVPSRGISAAISKDKKKIKIFFEKCGKRYSHLEIGFSGWGGWLKVMDYALHLSGNCKIAEPTCRCSHTALWDIVFGSAYQMRQIEPDLDVCCGRDVSAPPPQNYRRNYAAKQNTPSFVHQAHLAARLLGGSMPRQNFEARL